jgi:hypothetical protein
MIILEGDSLSDWPGEINFTLDAGEGTERLNLMKTPEGQLNQF